MERRFVTLVTAMALAAMASGPALGAADAPPVEPEDAFMGEYAGSFTAPDGKSVPAVANVVAPTPGAKGASAYKASLMAVEGEILQKTIPAKDAKFPSKTELSGQADGQKVALKGAGWTGTVADGKLTAEGPGGKFDLKLAVRKSPTELAPPPAGAVVLLAYQAGKAPSVDEWAKAWPALADGSMMVTGGTNQTNRKFSSFKLHLEFRVPTDGKSGGNSGVYILDRYEIQILDSFAKPLYKGGCAAVYQTFPPEINASLPRGRWQTYDITFRAPKMEGDKAVKLPVVTVEHNGINVHKDVEIPNATGNAKVRGHAASGPIVLQDHGSATRYRNIWLVELKD